MTKLLYVITLSLFVPLFAYCQAFHSGDIPGTIIIERKPVDFTMLTNPDGTADIPFFTHLPVKSEYISGKGKDIFSLRSINELKITRLSAEESKFVRDSCPGCYVYKATISFKGQPVNNVKNVYLALEYLSWKNTRSGEFHEPRMVELRYVNEIKMNEAFK